MLRHRSMWIRCLPPALLFGILAIVTVAQENRRAPTSAATQATVDSEAALVRMVAEGKSPRELAQYVFDTHACKECHTMGHDGKLGYTKKGEERAKGFEGCISNLKAMSIIAKVPEDQRSATQRSRAQRFEEFGCATCHKVTPAKMGLTKVGEKLAHLHLGCVEVEKLVANSAAAKR